jgi:polygalacturonase
MKRLSVLLCLLLTAVLATLQPVLADTASRSAAVRPTAATVFDVRAYGAKGDGSSNDTPAVNRAISAANAAGGGIVEFPSGNYRSRNSIRLKSNVTVQLDSGATLLGSSGTGYDAAEANPYDSYQDYGHSHFHDAMIWGDNLSNIGFTGSGTIDGDGNLITGNPGKGQADKILSLTRCTGLTLNGITLRRGGHFAALTNGCSDITSDHLRIDTASDRDGWNVINATHVTVTNAVIASNDDALVFKSDYALGASLPNGHVTVTGAQLSSKCCNALMFGSETCGSFSDYRFDTITITAAGKSGLGIVSMDGADISDVHYRNVTMTGVRSPIMQKIGTRKRCGGSPGVGHISDVSYTDVTGTAVAGGFSPTLWGEAGANRISNVSFDHVQLTVPGGSAAISTAVPSNNPTGYNPDSIGTRPAFGWYIHDADDIRFTDSSVRFAADDNRPAVQVDTAEAVVFEGLTAQRGSGSPFDVGFHTVTGYCLSPDSANTAGGALRVDSNGSSRSCAAAGTRYEAEDATLSAGSSVDRDHLGYSGTGFVNTPNAVGGYLQWAVQASAAGPADLVLGYANGGGTDRPAQFTVNGVAVGAALPLGGTGSWDTWARVTVPVQLKAGANTVRLTATTATGCPNVDYLDGP